MLTWLDGKIYAIGSKCAHLGAPLLKGFVIDDKIYCPFHLASFSIKTGMHEFGPSFKEIPTFEVKVENGWVFVKVPK